MAWIAKIKKFKKTVVNAFEELCDSGLNTERYHLLDHLVGDIRRLVTLSVLDVSPYIHFNVHIQQAYKTILPRRRKTVVKTVALMEGGYKRALS